ncbi:transposase [Ktedonobacteria bacterium brp13]|nr:transposase [Ktedonobacteria bacterium brp13]
MPAKASGEFVACMEDVLRVYQQAYDARYPQVCLDETSKQLLTHMREPSPMKPGKPKREDYEYERRGTCSIFLACEPLSGKRFVQASPQRTRQEWARFVHELIEKQYLEAEKVILVMDNLNTHTTGSLYETFAPEVAERLCRRLEIHYTPKHGSWLNMAEIELGILGRQCLDRRLASLDDVQAEMYAWQSERNQAKVTINWRFTTADTLIKLKRLYPSIEQ